MAEWYVDLASPLLTSANIWCSASGIVYSDTDLTDAEREAAARLRSLKGVNGARPA